MAKKGLNSSYTVEDLIDNHDADIVFVNTG